METQHLLAKTFLAMWETILFCFEANFYLLLLMVLNSACRRGYRELIPRLLSPEHLGDWILLGYSSSVTISPPGQWLLSHSLFESCPHLQPSLLLLRFSHFWTVLLEIRVAEPGWLLQGCAAHAFGQQWTAVQCLSLWCNYSQHKGHQACLH